MKKYRCTSCGDYFVPDKETRTLIEEGVIDPPNTCDFCHDNNLPDDDIDRIDTFSDADPGL